MKTSAIITLAQKHSSNGSVMQSSAVLCYRDAVLQVSMGNDELARAKALKSLQYSVGVFHTDYRKAISK